MTLSLKKKKKLVLWEDYVFGRITKVAEYFLQISEKAMAPHSSTLAWKIPWMEEPGRLQSTGSLRVGHN